MGIFDPIMVENAKKANLITISETLNALVYEYRKTFPTSIEEGNLEPIGGIITEVMLNKVSNVWPLFFNPKEVGEYLPHLELASRTTDITSENLPILVRDVPLLETSLINQGRIDENFKAAQEDYRFVKVVKVSERLEETLEEGNVIDVEYKEETTPEASETATEAIDVKVEDATEAADTTEAIEVSGEAVDTTEAIEVSGEVVDKETFIDPVVKTKRKRKTEFVRSKKPTQKDDPEQ
jgi:hypothetical protein